MSTTGSTFKNDAPLLSELLSDIHLGKIQLPDFQRGWVWDDDHIRSLIASVTLSYPIGAVMLLETGGEDVRFKARLIEGLKLHRIPNPEKLILDGQQRLTSLYAAIINKELILTKTDKNKEIKVFYYLDMEKCLDENSDRLDAVISIPSDKKVKSDFGRVIELDLSTQDKEFENLHLPINILLDTVTYSNWKNSFMEYFGYNAEKIKFLNKFDQMIWLPIQKYRVPVIELLKETPKEAVCQVFEKVNTGGVSLSVFELVTATFAVDNFELRKNWEEIEGRLKEYKVLHGFDNTSFLTSITLLSSYYKSLTTESGSVSCKRKDVLKISLPDYLTYSEKIEKALVESAKFLAMEKIFDAASLPYSTQLIPLSTIIAFLGDKFHSISVKQKVQRWFWSGVFGELYGGANESRFAFDLPEVIKWVNSGDEPRTVKDSSFNPMRLLSLQSRLSAAYKGLSALILKSGSKDFISGENIDLNSYFDINIDIHHIFPRNYSETNNLKKTKWNSIINKTPLSARSNRIIGGKSPKEYLNGIVRNHNIIENDLNEILKTNLINPDFLWNNNFEEFISNRASNLLNLIENATGKNIQGRESEEIINEFGDVI
ncbi:MAG: hypothetical protein HW421_1140 [Ignavibacteria bacterium]|nr:hypothetical protein [Ignavibacteria bacterium]